MNAFVSCLLLTLSVLNCSASDVTINTNAGAFIGFKEEVLLDNRNVTITKFLGIPYAESPIGDLRFRRPVPKAFIRKPLEVKKFGSACLQFYFMFEMRETDSEDCLFLNIYKPQVIESNDNLPVMVWIHGGGFVSGSANEYIGDALAANGPVIVVTLNYRLTVWGFLSTGNHNAPGNYGLWDQHLAIKWVHDNIEAFGGDTSRVTLFGESTGGASVIYQGLYPGNKGLFQRIIAQSGSPLSIWATSDDSPKHTFKLAPIVGCETGDELRMMECLRNVPTGKLNATINDPKTLQLKLPLPFIPNIDGDFVSIHPRMSIDMHSKETFDIRENFAMFDLIIGLNSGEGGGAVNPLFGIDVNQENFLPNKTYFDRTLVPCLLKSHFGEGYPSVMEDIVISEYTDWNDPENPQSIRKMYCDMQGDFMMLGCIDRTVRAHASLSNGRTFYYSFDLLPYKSIVLRPTWYNKALHMDELMYVFGNKLDFDKPKFCEKRKFQAWEKEASYNIMTMWTNFAKTGNPNEPRFIVNWEPYTSENHRYLHMYSDVTSSLLKERLRERQALLTDIILPEMRQRSKCNKNNNNEEKACRIDGICPRN